MGVLRGEQHLDGVGYRPQPAGGLGAPPHLVGLPVRGAPGPASIEGVRGSYVLIAQGHRGRHLYDYLTGQVHPADEQWNPVE